MIHRSHVALMSLTVLVLTVGAMPQPAAAEQRFIVRTAVGGGLLNLVDGFKVITTTCNLVGCSVRYGLDGGLNRLFLVTTPDGIDPDAFVAMLPTLPGIEHAEIDALVRTLGADADLVPQALLDAEPVTHFGTLVRGGYVRQPANAILGIAAAQERYGLTGFHVTVAVIDTGVDATHHALQHVLLEGYDFTRNTAGGSELSDVNQSIMWAVDEAQPGQVNQSTIAVLDQSTIGALDDAQYQAFGHGTMVAGLIHLVAPQASLLPLKAFRADGTGYSSDVIRAIYFAVRAGAKVMNMSFSFSTASQELTSAIEWATKNGVVPVASVGNDGQWTMVYPAGLPGVIGVASTTDYDALSSFSNFGTDVAWIAAPGEGVVTTYPLGTYAAAWGTSFSTPFAAGAAALLAEVESGVSTSQAADAQGYAVWVSPDISRGRLDIPAAIEAWRTRLGLH
jgi:subtilisin family serine protease